MNISLIPSYIYFSQCGDPYFYKTIDSNGHPCYVTHKPNSGWIQLFRSYIDDLQSKIHASPFHAIAQHCKSIRGLWHEPIVLTDFMYLCLRIWNPLIREFGSATFSLGTKRKLYSPRHLQAWEWCHANLGACQTNAGRFQAAPFQAEWRAITLLWAEDGQSYFPFGPSTSFLQSWLAELHRGTWISQYYLTQKWASLVESDVSLVWWFERWLTVLAFSDNVTLARQLAEPTKNSHSAIRQSSIPLSARPSWALLSTMK